VSLRARLLAGFAAVAVVLVTVAVLITSATRDHLVGQVDDRLRAAAGPERDRLIGLLGPTFTFSLPPGQASLYDGSAGQRIEPGQVMQGTTGQLDPDDEQPAGSPERQSDLFEGAVLPDGRVASVFRPNLGGEDPARPDVAGLAGDPPSSSTFFTTDALGGDGSYRVLARPSGLEGLTLVTAIRLDDVESTVSRLVLVEVIGTVAILSVLGLVTWWVVRLGIRPIKQMTVAAGEIAAGDLTVRVPDAPPGTESGDLAVALNEMLGTIERAVDERARSEEGLRRFVADASHELRTPVTTIRGYAELYRAGGLDDPAALDDAMRRTELEAARMGRLVEDMLALARLDEARPIANRPVDLAVIARDAGRDAQAVAPTRRITVDGAPSAVVNGDEDRLRQVVANVVGNALVHTDPATPIEIRVVDGTDGAAVEVEDHGEGMTPDVAARVTERFYRADPSRSRHRGGSGLGMAIVESAVTAHGGTVEIDSEPRRGTIVRITVPR
jgi:two-component system OmpR family sensor kinase